MAESQTESADIHWGSEDSRPTSLHGNGAASFGRTSLDWSEVTCGLCLSLQHAGGEPLCPACGHTHPDYDCDCGCEYDAAFCPRCGWLDCECPEVVTSPAETGASS